MRFVGAAPEEQEVRPYITLAFLVGCSDHFSAPEDDVRTKLVWRFYDYIEAVDLGPLICAGSRWLMTSMCALSQ